METVYHSILKGFNWILAGLLSLLGFSITSCGLQMSMVAPTQNTS